MEINFLGDDWSSMPRFLTASALMLLLFMPFPAEGQSISGPEVRLVNNDIYASFSFSPDEKLLQELRNGMDKEIRLYIDLFRVWKGWPDEFVLGRSYIRTLQSDPIKKEYIASSQDGNTITEKRFRSFESMIAWTMSVKDLKLTNTSELEPSQYFVRITVESRIRRLPPVLGHFLIFVKENEFKTKKDSGFLTIEGPR
jgi:hypothetical protein